MRKKTGNLVLELVAIAFSVGILALSLFFGPLGKDLTLFGIAIGHQYDNLTGIFTGFEFANLNIFYCVGLLLPLVTSILATLFRRFRIFNVLNIIGWGALLFVLFYSVYAIRDVSFIDFLIDSVSEFYYIILGLGVLGFATSVINTELCR